MIAVNRLNETSAKTRDELAADALPLVRYTARRFRSLPAGISTDDLESAGNEAVVESLAKFDPDGGVGWLAAVKHNIRCRMVDAIRAARSRAKGRVSMGHEDADGGAVPLPADPKADDPSEIAAAVENVSVARMSVATAGRRRPASTAEVAAKLPAVDEVRQKAKSLRSALFAAISAADMTRVAKSLVAAATQGDTRAAGLLIGLVNGAAEDTDPPGLPPGQPAGRS